VETAELAVGFADLCGYTRLARTLDHAALARLLDRFEEAATLVLPASGATVVKLLGDGALFHAPDAETAIDAALALIDEARADDAIPGVRVSIAYGTVLLRGGDCFGEVVNRAARLLDTAPYNGVAVDASALDPSRPWQSLGHRVLRDYGPWQVWTPVG
jgi:adenylate cyclase